MKQLLVSLAILMFCVQTVVHGQPPALKQTDQRPHEITANLETPIAVSAFSSPFTLKDGLFRLHAKLGEKKKLVTFRVDQNAFTQANPNAPDVFDTRVHPKVDDKELPASKLLALMLAEVSTKNAAYVLREGRVEITTKAKAKAQ